MKNRRKIIFNIGDENHIVVEEITAENIKTSLFADPYQYILNALDHYFDALPEKSWDYSKHNNFSKNDLWRNNIFAFIGERGSGKTSCMRSIVHLLENSKDSHLCNNVLKNNFFALDMIDPSFIDNDSNIIGVILATLYKKFLDYSKDKKVNEGERVKLAEAFAKVQHDFSRMMNEKAVPEDDLEALSSLSAAIDLRASMHELIEKFMKFIGMQNSVLLIPVDDIDLHSNAATMMVEQIRKYLVLPNVLIVMALKIDQLAKLKRLQFSREYRDEKSLNDNELDEMVDRYITKLLPYNHRVYMPEATVYWDAELQIKGKNHSSTKYESVRQAVPELIFRKTRYLFYNSAVKTSCIVPDNLRELRQLIRLLVDMNDYWQYDSDGSRVEESNNKEIFKKYLFESWMMNHLDSSSQDGIKELASVSDAIQINATALRIIRNKFSEELNSNLSDSSEMANILRSKNQVYNIAIGDVLAIIDFLERKDISVEQMYFLFMIKTLYSIRLYEFYDEFTDTLNEKKDNNGDLSSERVLARDLYEDMKLPNYMKLIGGRFFNTRMIVGLPKSQDKPYRSNRVINLDALRALMKFCIDEPQKTLSIEIRIAELFMLCTARMFKSRNYTTNKKVDYIEPYFREYHELVYSTSLTRKPKSYWDLGSFLFNVIDLDRCYKRFDYGDKFVDLLNQHYELYNKSLYQGFRLLSEGTIRNLSPKDYLDYCKNNQTIISYNDKHRDYDKHSWLSWVCVRNAEILCDLVSFLDEDEYKTTGEDVKMLERFFLLMSQYSIYSYDKTSNGGKDDYYRINYRFARLMMETLREIDSSYALKQIFMLIFDEYLTIGKTYVENYYEEKISQLMNDYYDETHGEIPVMTEDRLKSVLTNRKCSKSTLIEKILKLDSRFKKEPYRKMLNNVLPPYGMETMTVNDAPQILEAINKGLTSLKNGNAKTNNQDAIPTTKE